MDEQPYHSIHRVKESMWPILCKLKELAKNAEHPKARDYYQRAHDHVDAAYVKLQSAGWFAGSAINFDENIPYEVI